ncbi:hypothetical protein NC651_027749 [Populus alba x Populus x berolinensis]|nr:hypothetical protein NC651_027749 [Populus alba x Populus x berolinensis]
MKQKIPLIYSAVSFTISSHSHNSSSRFPPTLFNHFIKMSEIVLADPIIEPQRTDRALVIDHAAAASSSGGRFRAFEIAHGMDSNSSGRGVRQFKTSLLQRLEQVKNLMDEFPTLMRRKEKSDMRELRRVYHAYKECIKSGGAFDLDGRFHDYCMCFLLPIRLSLQALADTDSIRAKSELYLFVNIRGLPSAEDLGKPFMDLFEFLEFFFEFQEGNVANQREHLILLLAEHPY